jgi:hypothetical protein
MSRARQPYEVAAGEPPDRLVAALVRNLADAVDGQVAFCVPSAGELTAVAAWPELLAIPSGEVVREQVAGDGVLLVAGLGRRGDREHAMVRETAGWLGVAVRLAELTADRERAETRARTLRAEVSATRERLARVRDLERRRLVAMITMTSRLGFDTLRDRLHRLGDPGVDGSVVEALAGVRVALDELLESVRTVVRGVYPAMLPDHGPRVALEELAAVLPRPVRFGGNLGGRVSWQVESGLYHAVAAVLRVLAGEPPALPPAGSRTDPAADPTTDPEDPAPAPIMVDFHPDDALRVRITAPPERHTAHSLHLALAQDAERLAVLGGALDCVVTANRVVVDVRLAVSPEPVATDNTAAVLVESGIYQRVWELVRQGKRAAATEPERTRWEEIAARLLRPPRLAVVTGTAGPDGVADAVHDGALGVTVVVAQRPADAALAMEFLADDGPRGAIDAVLCLVPPDPAFRTALRGGRQRIELSESASLESLAGKLVAWRPVIAARRAVVSVRELLTELPGARTGDDQLWWALDRVGAEAGEIAELDLLDELERGEIRLLGGVGVDAARLLGSHGTDPKARLGLPHGAGDAQVRAAAEDTVRRWRAHAEHPVTSTRDRQACEVLVRTAESILRAERTP